MLARQLTLYDVGTELSGEFEGHGQPPLKHVLFYLEEELVPKTKEEEEED